MSTTNTATANTEELFALAPYIAGLDASNDVDACDAFTTNDPDAVACGVCRACMEARESLDDGRDEAFTLVGLGPFTDETSAPRRCPGGCYGGLVADPRGPSTHNPTGLRECPVCG